MRALPALRSVLLVALVTAGTTGPAAAYEFEIDAVTVGQAYQLRSPRRGELDVVLNRRRLTQTLGLDIWGILEPQYDSGRPDEPPLAPFDVFISASARVLHDFGDYTGGSVIYATGQTSTIEEAVTSAVPELAGEHVAIDLLWANAGARGILGRIDLTLGRQMAVSELDWFAFDGLSVAARLPAHIAVEAQGGLLVRDGSFAGAAAQEPDGTGSAQCMAFSETDGLYAPSGCTMRDRLAPTFGAAIATHGLRSLSARLSYRRSISRTDAGVYPGAADPPGWGVLEEKLAATARARLFGGAVTPYGAARWSFLLGLLDEAQAGVRVALGAHTFTPEWRYSFPSFDGDSIFNVFSAEPFWDARLTYDLWPGRGPVRAYARGFLRHFDAGDTSKLEPGMTLETGDAWGVGAGARLILRDATLRLDGSYEDGYGGLRAAGDVSGSWRPHRKLEIEGRLSLVRFEEDMLDHLRATTFAAQAGAVFTLGPGMALHLIAEENANRLENGLRLLAILDLAFRPEH